MKRSIFILFLMLQWTRPGCGSENIQEPLVGFGNKYMEMRFEDNEGSLEEPTTISYENNPPIMTPTSLEEIVSSRSPLLTKLVSFEQTEQPVETFTETPIVLVDIANDEHFDTAPLRQMNSKAIKPRLLETKTDDIVSKPEHKDDETLEILTEEDTTTIAELDAESNETNIDIGDEETTIQTPTSKKPKKIEIYKTRPNELLRHYVEDSHLRSPIAALIDKKSNPLAKAKKLWKAALRPNSLLDIMVVSYDSEGIKSTYNLTNTRAMMSTLDRVREENVTTQESKTYYSIIRTGQLIPYDSAIFLSTDKLPNDTEHQQPASMILLKKRIRLYLVIFDEKNHVVNANSTTAVRQTGFLGQLALRTGGDVIYVPNHAFRIDGEMGLITLVVGNRLKPIDSELREVYENELKNDTTDIVGENEEKPSI